MQWPSWWQVLLSVASGLVLAWAVLVLALWRQGARRPDLVAAARLLPDLLRLLPRLARDPALPRRARVWLLLLLAYLASPVDLVPDVVPVVGLLDDVLLVLVVLRAVVRATGPDVLQRQWPGDAAGLAALRRLVGIRAAAPP